MEYIQKERVKEILGTYNGGKKDLFNWCNEYKDFINENVLYCVSYEWDYMLKKSYEDNESPVSYDDFEYESFDYDKSINLIEEETSNIDEDDTKNFLKEVNEWLETDFKTVSEFIDSLEDYEEDDFIKLTDISFFTHLNEEDFKSQNEVYEWWLLSDPLKYRLEEQGEIFLNDAWGRQTTGQSISLDYCCIKAFISMLEERKLD